MSVWWNLFIFVFKWIMTPCAVVKILTKLTMGRCKSNTCLIGKTVIITGGNSGLGYQTALVLAGRGAKVIIADKDDSTAARKKIIQATNNPNVTSKFVDLSSLASVRQFAREINEEEIRLDVLINNAGVGAVSDECTSDGLDIQTQINHFGPFLLTHLLIDMLKKSAPSRIIFLSSIAAFIENLDLKKISSPNDCKGSSISYTLKYGNSKLLNLITSNGFSERLRGTGVTSNAVHPGLVATPIYQTLYGPHANRFLVYLQYAALKLYGKSPYEGAQGQINCALSNKLEKTTGKYFIDCRPFFQPKKAKDTDFCRKVWEKSEELVKLKSNEKI